MRRERFEYNSTLMRLSDEVVHGAFAEAVHFTELLDTVTGKIPALTECEKNGDKSGFITTSFELLDQMLEENEKLSVDNLEQLCDSPIANTEVLMKRISAIGADIVSGKEGLTRRLARYLEDCCDGYSFPSGKNLELLAERIEYYLGHLCFLIYYQYGLHHIESGSVTEPVFQFCAREGLEVLDILDFWKSMLKKHRPVLTVFEEYPDLEDSFWDAASAYMSDFDYFADILTKDDVLAIIAPGADVEALLLQVVMQRGSEHE